MLVLDEAFYGQDDYDCNKFDDKKYEIKSENELSSRGIDGTFEV